jgi:hypothetical protein
MSRKAATFWFINELAFPVNDFPENGISDCLILNQIYWSLEQFFQFIFKSM